MIEKTDLDQLERFVTYADEDTFRRAFGDRLGEHLFRKYRDYNHDVVRLWSSLSPEENRDKLLNAINTEGLT